MNYKHKLLEDIINIEQQMFLSVKTIGTCSCKENLDDFKLHRKVQFITWNKKTLESYLKHVKQSWEAGINLMTIKYARMENKISPWSTNPLIKEIAEYMLYCQEEMHEKYPNLMKRARKLKHDNDEENKRSFFTYISCELETYSDETLENLFEDIKEKDKNNKNISIESYVYMATELGYESLEELDRMMK